MHSDRRAKVIAIQIRHGTNHANVIDLTSDVWEQITDFRSTFSIGPKLPPASFVKVSIPMLLIMP